MVPMPSTEHDNDPAEFDAPERALLLDLARAGIQSGWREGRPLRPDPADYPPHLRAPRAAFVTLERHGRLRGCIGSLKPVRPLVVDVAENAYAAAFRDPRFPPLRPEEWEGLHIDISVLGEPRPLPCRDEADLLRQLRPGSDGLILEDGLHRATFLPAVWHSLPDPRDFVRQLKIKAGLPADHWSPGIRVYRYTTESFGAPA